uniref:NPC1 like intracellular cholesterol transporter 1 n=1 Tax=Anas platyrhynchos TaxID=8839 RepID=A0A8B9R6N4_ANAPL
MGVGCLACFGRGRGHRSELAPHGLSPHTPLSLPRRPRQQLTPIHRAGYCAFYDECGRNPEVNVSLVSSNVPCLYNGPAHLATGALLQLLRSVCPELVRGDNDTRVCCTLRQLTALQVSVALSGTVLARCPSCSRNFANLYCNNICSPDQSLFTNVTRMVNRTTALGVRQEAVVEYQCFYSQRYADAAFNSCKDVRLPATGGYAIDTMCGIYGARLCTTQRWLDFQGDKNNGLAPLQIDFQLVPNGTQPGDGIEPLDERAWGCSEALSADQQPCSCQDCAESCPAVPAPPDPAPPFRLGAVDGALVICALLFGFFALVFLTCLDVPREEEEEGQPTASWLMFSAAGARWWPGTRCRCWWWRRWWRSGCLVGMVTLQLTTDPVELWSAPGSQARQEKAFYDEHFGPFLRTCQVIVTARDQRPGTTYNSVVLGAKNFSRVLSAEVLEALLELQDQLTGASVWVEEEGREVTLQDVCYCAPQPLRYFQNNRTHLAMEATQTVGKETGTVDWHDHLIYCVNSPLSFKDITTLELSCMAEYGGPVFPYIALGGYPDSEYTQAEALIVTYSLNNFPRSDPRHQWVLSWEQRFLEVVRDFQRNHSQNLSVSFMAERSLEDEINRTTGEDIPVFAVSYLVVFAYIALALGEYTAWRRVLVESKVTLALGGIAVVLGAVFASMGFLALLGQPSSLIILEVVPFLVLAVGADNIFIFVQEYQQSQREPGETREEHIGRVLAQVAPSMLLCSISEVICFLLGSLSSMPAVRTFALTASVAIAFDFLLQMSGFVALLALDARRQEAARFDICCCCGTEKGDPTGPGLRVLRPFLDHFYTPLLLHRLVRPLVVSGGPCLGMRAGLGAPTLAEHSPCHRQDSYMLQYFADMNQYLPVGVPTYFVTTSGYNFSSTEGTNAVCSSAGCDDNSLTQMIQYATRFPNVSYLAIPATSWVDDFLDWLNPTGRCCRIHQFGSLAGQFCPSTSSEWALVLAGGGLLGGGEGGGTAMPGGWMLGARPWPPTAPSWVSAGRVAGAGGTPGCPAEPAAPPASRFMAYQRPLRTSQEYTAALRAARALAENITGTLRQVPGTDPDFRVFPYTVTYVYYEQYLTVVGEGLFTLTLCLVPTFLVSFMLLGMDLRSSVATLITITMILLDTVGIMALWDIPYNAVALINLVAAVGISVEFVSHLTCAFAHSTKPTRVERAAEATVTMGSKVVAGVAMTNLPGIVVLAFAKAQLIQIFFFRLNLIITLAGLAHGLVFLPVLLSYMGKAPGDAVLSPRHPPPCPVLLLLFIPRSYLNWFSQSQ